MARTATNKRLRSASTAKKDEFYTLLFMDTKTIIYTIVLAVLANLITPMIRNFLYALSIKIMFRIKIIPQKIISERISQIQNEIKYITKLYENPKEIMIIFIYHILPIVFISWVLTFILYLDIIIPDFSLRKSEYIQVFIASIGGLGSRFFVSLLVFWIHFDESQDFEKYNLDMTAELKKLNNILEKRKG